VLVVAHKKNTELLLVINYYYCDDKSITLGAVNLVATVTSTGTPTAGETFSLDCSVSGIDDSATYQWFDSNGTQLTNTSELQFSPLRVSEGGVYTCRATVRGVVADETTTISINRKYWYTAVFPYVQDYLSDHSLSASSIFCDSNPFSWDDNCRL
jgi:hypothetical protein